MSAPKLDEIGEQQPEKKAANCRQGGFNDQREPLAPVHPGDAVDSRQRIEQPHQLAALEIIEVGRTGKYQLTRKRVAVKVRADLVHLVMVERLARLPLDRGCKAVGCSQRAVPQDGCDNRCGDSAAEQEHAFAARLMNQRRLVGQFLGADNPYADRNRTGENAEHRARPERRPQIAPEGVHAFSRASSRQPMSRRWKPSAKSICSTALYARARALANVSATAVT